MVWVKNIKINRLAMLLLSLSMMLSGRVALAIDAVDASQNSRWHSSDTTGAATFLGGDKAETAVLTLNKAKVLGQTLTVNADASYIMLHCGDSPHIVLTIPANSAGTTTKIVLTGGDTPTLLINDKEEAQQQGKWMQIVAASGGTITMELGTTSFATVKFEHPAAPAPKPAVVPVPAPAKPDTSKELLQTVTPGQLTAAANAFDQGIHKKCTVCSGTGQVSYQVQTGSHVVGPYSVPDFQTQKKKCEHCNGTGIDRARDDALIRLSGLVVKDMAGVKKDDPRTQTTLTDTYHQITKDMIGDEKTWTLLTGDGRSILAQKTPKIGTTVVSMVAVKKSLKREDGARRFLVRILGTDKEVYVDDPTLADEVNSGHALMGGIVDTPIAEGKKGDTMTVLRGGFLIAPPVEHDWTWWSRAR